MTVRTVSNLPAATHGETVRCLFAIELSKESWIIGFITPLSTRIGRRILSGGDWKGLLKLIDEVRARVSLEMGRTVEMTSCYEAGYDGFWLHRQLEAHGVRNYVIDPASLQVDRRSATSKDGSDRHRAVATFADGVSLPNRQFHVRLRIGSDAAHAGGCCGKGFQIHLAIIGAHSPFA